MKLLFVFTLFVISTQTIFSDDRSALLTLRSSVGGRTLRWNTTSGEPCIWSGVRCNEAHQITALRLPGDSLSGELPSGVFGTLIHLRTLSLRLNSLTGSLPSDLGSCSGLRNLYLQGNRFSGEIPLLLFGLKDLVRVNLARNEFSGAIPVGFNGLSRVRTLYLESNQLVGSIPDFKLPKLEQFNVSLNRLNGSIPASLGSMDASAFFGNSLCGAPLDSCSGNGNSINVDENGKKKKKGLSGGAIAGIVIGSVLGFLLILLVLIILCRKKSRKNNRSVDISSLKQQEVEKDGDKPVGAAGNGGMNTGDRAVAVGAGAMAPVGNENGNGKGAVNNGLGVKKLIFFGNATRVFDLEDLLRASAEVLGKGTFGTAYKAIMHVGPAVAVKRLKDVTISENEFKEKIQVVGGMDNANLVLLRAYYFSRDEKLLVYDYMNMGSLSALLHGNKGAGRTPLNWAIRYGIALGAARGIEYLHSQGPTISHGNIKSSNILLTESYEARVADFGLAHLVGPSSTPNRAAGYRAPEVTDPRKVSQKADVYSFGVLILELLTGKAPTHALLNDEGVDLPRWVQSIVREEWTSEVFDLELLREQNVEEEMVQLLQLAIDCAAQYPDNRPSMSEVTRRIEDLSRSSALEYHEDTQPDQIHDVKH